MALNLRPRVGRLFAPFTTERRQERFSSRVVRAPSAARRHLQCRAAAEDGSPAVATVPAASTPSPAASAPEEEEDIFYQGSGSNVELGLSLMLGITLIYLPLTLASIGRRLWVSYKFTNKRLVVTTDSPALKREVAVAYTKIREVRSVPRGLGLWGDMVVFLKDGSRLEITGLDQFAEIRNHIEQYITE